MKAMGFPLTEQPEAGKTPMPTRKVDILLLFAVTFLLSIGIGMVMSASLSTSQPFRLFSRQLISGVIALGVMIVVARIDYHLWFEWRLLLYAGGMISLIALYIPHVGMVMNGARRWIHLAGLTLQPSELARDAMIILTAVLLVKARKLSPDGPLVLPRKNLISFGVFLGLYVVLILREPDFGSCVFMLSVLFLMFFLGGSPSPCSRGWRRQRSLLLSGFLFITGTPWSDSRISGWLVMRHRQLLPSLGNLSLPWGPGG